MFNKLKAAFSGTQSVLPVSSLDKLCAFSKEPSVTKFEITKSSLELFAACTFLREVDEALIRDMILYEMSKVVLGESKQINEFRINGLPEESKGRLYSETLILLNEDLINIAKHNNYNQPAIASIQKFRWLLMTSISRCAYSILDEPDLWFYTFISDIGLVFECTEDEMITCFESTFLSGNIHGIHFQSTREEIKSNLQLCKHEVIDFD